MNTVGGTTAGAGNLISGNGADGIDIVNSTAQGNLVEGNLIGTGADGTQNLGNQEGGISIFDGAADNTIGGLAGGSGNVIANNSRLGVNVGVYSGDNCPGNEILSNSIYNNAPQGIDLGFNGITLNTPGGHTSGPNNLQNFPVFYTAVSFSGTRRPCSAASTAARIPRSPCNSSPTRRLIPRTTVKDKPCSARRASPRIQAQRQLRFISPVVVPAGYAISATATDTAGDTSEFARTFSRWLRRRRSLLAMTAIHRPEHDTDGAGAGCSVQRRLGRWRRIHIGAGFFALATEDALNPDGSFSYTPDANFGGIDSFTYEDQENGQSSNVATVTLLVNPLTLYVTNTLDDGSLARFAGPSTSRIVIRPACR